MEDKKLQLAIEKLFDTQGNCKLIGYQHYFDEDGDLLDYFLLYDHYKSYPVDSDIVKMFYAAEFANHTHGNYSPATLYYRL